MQIRKFTWDEIMEYIKKLIKLLPDTPYTCYGPPTSGMILAGIICQHKQLYQQTGNPEHASIIVDDIADSGRTLQHLHDKFPVPTATLFLREKITYSPDYYVEIVPKDLWLIFPWEKELSDGALTVIAAMHWSPTLWKEITK